MKQSLFLLILCILFLIPCFAQENISCPNIKVVTVNKIYELGFPMDFSISPGDELKNLKLDYKWKISDGIIEQGQGTPAILISTAGLADLRIIATVEIKGLPQNCPNTFSGTAIIPKRPLVIIHEHDEDNLLPGEIKARVINFYTALDKQPTARGVIIIYGTNKEIAKREAEIRKIGRSGKYNIKRVEFIRDNRQPGVRTRFFIVPKGEKTPIP